MPRPTPIRFAGLASERVLGVEAIVATTLRSRLLGLALLDRDRAPEALLIPRCACVHTLGTRFPLDVLFLDRRGQLLRVERGVVPGRLLACRGAAAVLELAGPRVERGGGRDPGRRG